MAEEKKLEQEYLPEEITEKDVKKSWLTYTFLQKQEFLMNVYRR